MCALFGFLDYKHQVSARVLQKLLQALANASEVRGTHASGIAYNKDGSLTIYKRPKPAHKMRFKLPHGTSAVMGHTRFTTQGSQKQNYNNHPFRGHAGEDFALAHNGVLYNDKQLRRDKYLPLTRIETDSYIAVQLLEAQNSLDFEALRSMAEDVCGSYTFTILTEQDTLYFIKGSSPLYLIHFPELGLYIYSSTAEIMHEALKMVGMLRIYHDIISVQDGEIVKLTPDGNIERSAFQVNEFDYFSRNRCHFGTLSTVSTIRPLTSSNDEALEELLELCGYFGMDEETVMYLWDCGYTLDEIEKFLWEPDLLRREFHLDGCEL